MEHQTGKNMEHHMATGFVQGYAGRCECGVSGD